MAAEQQKHHLMIPTNLNPTAAPNASVQAIASRLWEVGGLVRALSDALQARFNPVAVRGEILGFSRATSGHCYFTLKDTQADSAISCAMFRRVAGLIDFSPQNGDVVELRGRVAVYEARGSLQLVAEHLSKVQTSQGALWAKFEQTKALLASEGLFDRKRPVPRFVRCVAVVTSLQAAALQDVLTALARRVPHVSVRVFPCAVQGVNAVSELVSSLSKIEQQNQQISWQTPKNALFIDAVLLVRGGGSLEDLWPFNEQAVVRAVAACSVPLICGVGHETDFSLCDFAADVRAPTPTAAAELVSEPTAVWLGALEAVADRLTDAMQRRLDQRAQRLDFLAQRVGRPLQPVQPLHRQLTRVQGRARQAVLLKLQQQSQSMCWQSANFSQKIQLCVAHRRAQLDTLGARLEALNPQQVLARGFALLADAQGRALTQVGHFGAGQAVSARVSDGVVGLTVD